MCRFSWNPGASTSWNPQGPSTRIALTRETNQWHVQFILKILVLLFYPPVLHLRISPMQHVFSTLGTPTSGNTNNINVGGFTTCDGVYTNTSSSCAVAVGDGNVRPIKKTENQILKTPYNCVLQIRWVIYWKLVAKPVK